ncbi:MAG TPA: hypothetical protein VGS19_37970 [Streptosporangiaceae bacterium]|nr:hypothetical protein [Streptosporangiaceae bacterium]
MTHDGTVRIDYGGWISGPCLGLEPGVRALDPPLPPGTRRFLDALDAVLSLPVTDPRLTGRARTCAAVLRTAHDAVTDDDLEALALVLWDAVAV